MRNLEKLISRGTLLRPFANRSDASSGIYLGFSFMIFLIVFLAVIALVGMFTSQARLENIVNENVKKFDIVVNMQLAVQLSSLNTQQLVLREAADREILFQKLASKQQLYEHARRELSAMPLSETETEIIHRQDNNLKKIAYLTNKITAFLEKEQSAAAENLYLTKVESLYQKSMQSLSQLYKLSEQSIEISSLKAERDHHFAWVLTGLMSILAVMVGIAIAIKVTRRSDRLQRDRAGYLTEIQRTNRELRYIADDLAVARDRAQQSNQAKSAFLANMSHELRTPLNAIIGYSEMLHEDALKLPESDFAHDLKKIHFSGRHLLSLINEILDLSQIEAGRTRLDPEQFPVQLLIEEVISTVRPLAEKNRSSIYVDCEDDIGGILTDRVKLRQVLINLLSNACKFTSDGDITFTVRSNNKATQRKLVFTIEDNGIGMTEEQLGRVFEPFAQADNSTTRKYGGTGLGLTICKRFCEALGGSVKAYSEAGKGSRFVVKIPANLSEVGMESLIDQTVYPDISARSANELPSGVQERRKGLSTVLVIDDDPAAREMTARLCCREGFLARTANDGKAGIKLAVELRPDVIVLDIVMPGMDGWDTIRCLHEEPSLVDTPIIITSMLENRELGKSVGAFEFLTKPVDHATLTTAIKQCVRASHTDTVLLVEENPEMRAQLAQMLERSGWTVTAVGEAAKGMEVLENQTVKLVIADLATPDCDGYEIIKTIRATPELSDLPVIALATRDQFTGRRDILDKLSVTIVNKYDFSRDTLAGTVREMLEKDLSSHTDEQTKRIA